MMTKAASSGIVPVETTAPPLRPTVKFAQLLRLSDDTEVLTPTAAQSDSDYDERSASPNSNPSATSSPGLSNAESSSAAPFVMSPWTHSSPYVKSPWIKMSPPQSYNQDQNGLIATLLRKEGHVYSLAASGDMLFTGSDARNIGVWKDLKDFGGFKSNAGLVKAILVSGNSNTSNILTGHQDGKIRVWKVSVDNPAGHKRIGSLPTFKDYLKSSMNPKTYVQARRHRKVPRVKHFDAVSCLGLNHEAGILYSGSWDKTIKVWRLSDSKCLESIGAHDDAINSVVVGIDGMMFSGSADGTVKAWRRELQGRNTKHFLVQTLLAQQNAVTALAANAESGILYSGSSDGLMNFWEGDGMLSYGGVLRGHKLAVLCLATAGTLLFSGSADKSICVWKLETYGVHTCLAVLTAHSGPVKCLAVDVDNQTDDGYRDDPGKSWIVYSGSLDKSVKVWRVHD